MQHWHIHTDNKQPSSLPLAIAHSKHHCINIKTLLQYLILNFNNIVHIERDRAWKSTGSKEISYHELANSTKFRGNNNIVNYPLWS